MMDAIETKWATVKKAHSVLLQTMERGKCSWENFENVDEIRMRCNQRTLQRNSNHSGGTNAGANAKRGSDLYQVKCKPLLTYS